MDEWQRGVLTAVSVMLACHDQPVIAADILHEMGMASADCSELEEHDKRNLRRVRGERGGRIKLRGLGRKKMKGRT